MMQVLFICGKARMRSPTAASVASDRMGWATDFAGLSKDADERVSLEQIEWADVIAVMERAHRKRLAAQFGRALNGKRVVSLDIPDRYRFMQPELIGLLEQRLPRIAPADH